MHPVAWSLLVEAAFYGLCTLTLNLIKSRPRLVVLVNLGVCGLVIATCYRWGPQIVHLSFFLMFVPYLILGQCIYILVEQADRLA